MPKRVKHRKVQRGSRAGKANSNNKLDFGEFGLQAMTRGTITSRQIEAARVTVIRHMKRTGKLWIRMFPDKPTTKKPLEVRMGKGKGPLDQWVAVIKPGRVLLEIDGCNEDIAKEALAAATNKFAIKCKLISRSSSL